MHVIHVHLKDTAHYAAWRDAVAPLMAEPRRSTKYVNLFPDDELFSTPRGGR